MEKPSCRPKRFVIAIFTDLKKVILWWLKQPSLVWGVGYELAYAEKINKPVLILHRNRERHLSAMISGTRHFNNINYYSTLDEAQRILESNL